MLRNISWLLKTVEPFTNKMLLASTSYDFSWMKKFKVQVNLNLKFRQLRSCFSCIYLSFVNKIPISYPQGKYAAVKNSLLLLTSLPTFTFIYVFPYLLDPREDDYEPQKTDNLKETHQSWSCLFSLTLQVSLEALFFKLSRFNSMGSLSCSWHGWVLVR